MIEIFGINLDKFGQKRQREKTTNIILVIRVDNHQVNLQITPDATKEELFIGLRRMADAIKEMPDE